MLLVLAPTRAAGDRLIAERPGFPPVSFQLEGPYLAAADYVVANPDGDGNIAQHFLLEGEYPDKGVHWPQTISIFHGSKPYFILDLETVSVELV
jgi:hypothetical protein